MSDRRLRQLWLSILIAGGTLYDLLITFHELASRSCAAIPRLTRARSQIKLVLALSKLTSVQVMSYE